MSYGSKASPHKKHYLENLFPFLIIDNKSNSWTSLFKWRYSKKARTPVAQKLPIYYDSYYLGGKLHAAHLIS